MSDPYNEIRNYLNLLIHRLLFIKGLHKQLNLLKEWETPNRVKALEIGSYFYRLVWFSFERTILIELCLVINDKEEKNIHDWLNKAYSHAKSLNLSKCDRDTGKRTPLLLQNYFELINRHQTDLISIRSIIDNIKGRRDKSLAHSDAKYFNNPDEAIKNFPIEHEDIDQVIDLLTEILRSHYVCLFESDLDIQVHSASNVDRILMYSRAFDRVWHDKRARHLFPYLYKLDNFEQELEKHEKYNFGG